MHILANNKIAGRTSKMIQPQAHGHLLVLSYLIKVSHPTDRKAFVTLELRKDRSSSRRKRRCRLRRPSIRVVLGIQEGMTVKSQAYRRWSRVFVWVEMWLTAPRYLRASFYPKNPRCRGHFKGTQENTSHLLCKPHFVDGQLHDRAPGRGASDFKIILD